MGSGRDLVGHVALVTGGGSGIGRSTCVLLAERGAKVVAADVDEPAADLVAAEIIGAGGEAMPIRADVSHEADANAMTSAAVARFGRLDILVANAAIHGVGSVLATSIDTWDAVLGVDLRGVFLSCRASIPHLVDAGGGSIVLVSSDSVIRVAPEEAAYATAKHALHGLAASIAVDFGRNSIRANVIVPGVTDTPGLRSMLETQGRSVDAELRHAAGLSPLGRVAQANDIAEAVAFLSGPGAAYITGATIVVDGGMTIAYPAG